MLVLGRKENESIIIGDNIRVTIVGRSGSSIRVGVEAPHDVQIVRAEIATQQRGAAQRRRDRRLQETQRCDHGPDTTSAAQPESASILAVLPTLTMPPQAAG